MQTETLPNKQLRNFGLILASGLGLLFGIIPLIRHHDLHTIPLMIAGFILALSFIKASLLKVIYKPWMKIGHVLGWINTRIILGVIYFLLITPIGLVMRLFGVDRMHRCYDKSMTSYRIHSHQSQPQDMERPF